MTLPIELTRWKRLAKVGEKNSVQGRKARRQLFKLFLTPGPSKYGVKGPIAARAFVANCIRRILDGERPSDVMSCGLPGPSEGGAKRQERGQAVVKRIAGGERQHVAVKNVAKDFRRSPKTIRTDLRFHKKQEKVDTGAQQIISEFNSETNDERASSGKKRRVIRAP